MATYVLVHGAYQGGWIWKPVIDTPARGRAPDVRADARRLRRAPPPRPARHHGGHARPGDRAAHVLRGPRPRRPRRNELRGHGHLQGRRAGARPYRAARLRRRAGADARRARRRHRQARRRPTRPPRSRPGPRAPTWRSGSSATSIPTLRAWALARYTPHPVAALEAPVELGSFWTQAWPTTVIRCRRATNPPEAHQRRTAERLKGAWHELDTGHYPMLSQPEELTRLLLAPAS